jgi:UDP-GlcNAc:undecaprenyl-phosphate GlcNAc-1-phosphate transferase
MDGIDGLVTQFSFLIFALNFVLGFLLNNVFIMFISITFIGVLLGFMIYNVYPARIFLGDGGSLTLGLFLVVTCIEVSLTKYSGSLNLTPAVFTLALPVIDTVRVVIIRLINKKSPFLPDQNHLHHRILKGGIDQKSTVMILLAISLIFLFSALFYFRENYFLAYILFILGIVVVFSISSVIKFVAKVSTEIKFISKVLWIVR